MHAAQSEDVKAKKSHSYLLNNWKEPHGQVFHKAGKLLLASRLWLWQINVKVNVQNFDEQRCSPECALAPLQGWS